MQRPLLRHSILLLLACWTSASACGGEQLDLRTIFREGIPPSPFIAVVYRCADTMLEQGRDERGPQIDQNVLRVLYFLVGLSGEQRYGKASDEQLTWLLNHVGREETPRKPWLLWQHGFQSED